MANPEWGKKRTCPSCGVRFYDFDKEFPLSCPKCETAFTPDPVLKPRRARVEDAKPEEAEDAKKDEDDIEDIELEDDIDDSDDDSLLMTDDDDDDDASDVVPIKKPTTDD